jgi:hypothetical protein
VVLEKAGGAKARKLLASGSLGLSSIFDEETWNRQIVEDLGPVISGIVNDASIRVSSKTHLNFETKEDEGIEEASAAQLERLKKINTSTATELTAAVIVASALTDDDGGDASPEDKLSLLKTAIGSIFVAAQTDRQKVIVENEAITAYNTGVFFAGKGSGAASKTWLTRMDGKVRPEHLILHGKSVDISDGFAVGEQVLRYPGDPLASPNLTVNCRCTLAFSD